METISEYTKSMIHYITKQRQIDIDMNNMSVEDANEKYVERIRKMAFSVEIMFSKKHPF